MPMPITLSAIITPSAENQYSTRCPGLSRAAKRLNRPLGRLARYSALAAARAARLSCRRLPMLALSGKVDLECLIDDWRDLFEFCRRRRLEALVFT